MIRLSIIKRNTQLWFATLLTLLLTLPLTAYAQVIVEAHTDTASILIGEQIQIHVKCTVNAGQHVTFPSFSSQQQLINGVEVVKNGNIDTLKLNDGKRISLTRSYTITSFDSAMYNIPPFQVNVDGKTYQSKGNIGLKVSTVAVDLKHPNKYNGPHAVVEQPFEWSWSLLLLSLLCVVLLGAVIAIAIRLTDPKLITRRVVINPPTPAHVTALNNIEHIKSKPAEDVKQYYMELTETLRTYIESRFGFSAKEMTTNEIVRHLYDTHNEEAMTELKSVLETADLVKFAKHKTTLSEQDQSLVNALSYVQTTKQQPQELPQPRVEYVSLSNKQQIRWRNIMHVAAWIMGLGALILSGWIAYQLYCCFG